MLIADFGLSKEEALITSHSSSIKKGMPAYIDPQCHKNTKYKRTRKSDIFSFGIVLWEISSRRVPFAGLKDLVVLMKVANGIREERVEGTPPSYFELYTKCWNDDPSKRPFIEEVVEILENCNSEFGNNTSSDIPTIDVTPSIMDVGGSTPPLTISNPSNPTTREIINEIDNDGSLCL